ncbi:MAG: VWA domain-containing protein [Nitrospina sp.]|jgi:Mg-chelatase subunit ChlD|nr:VWA domain-containing protein [Nitrospina sp.]
MKGQFKAYILIVFLVLVTQQNATAGLKLKIHSYDVSQFPSIRIFLTVEKDGAAIKSPILSQFKAAMEDKEALALKQVSSLKKSGENIALLLAVDTSGSMKKNQISAIKGAIKKLMEQKAPQDLVGLLSFNDDVFEDCDFTENADIFLKKLDALHCRGKSTVLFKAVFTGLEMLERPDLPRLRYLVVLSDGKDEGVGFTLDDAIANAKKFNVPIYTIGFSGRADAKFLDNMVRLAKMTGGEYRKVSGSSGLYEAYAAIAGNILDQQVLELEADFRGDGLKHHLEVQYADSGGEICKGEIDFLAPLFKEVTKKPSSEDSETESRSREPVIEVIGNMPNILVVVCLGTVAVAILVLGILVLNKRKRKTMSDNAHETKPSEVTGAEPAPLPEEKPMTPPNPNPLILLISGKGIEIPLKPEPMTIGAYPDCAIVLEGDTVSGYHSEISGDGNQWVLKDLGSTNGTRLNGEYIKETVFIKEGDMIRIGPIEIVVKSEKNSQSVE